MTHTGVYIIRFFSKGSSGVLWIIKHSGLLRNLLLKVLCRTFEEKSASGERSERVDPTKTRQQDLMEIFPVFTHRRHPDVLEVKKNGIERKVCP